MCCIKQQQQKSVWLCVVLFVSACCHLNLQYSFLTHKFELGNKVEWQWMFQVDVLGRRKALIIFGNGSDLTMILVSTNMQKHVIFHFLLFYSLMQQSTWVVVHSVVSLVNGSKMRYPVYMKLALVTWKGNKEVGLTKWSYDLLMFPECASFSLIFFFFFSSMVGNDLICLFLFLCFIHVLFECVSAKWFFVWGGTFSPSHFQILFHLFHEMPNRGRHVCDLRVTTLEMLTVTDQMKTSPKKLRPNLSQNVQTQDSLWS